MSKTLKTRFELLTDAKDISILIEYLNGTQKTQEDITKHFTSKGISTDREYINKLLETAIKHQWIIYGKPIFEKKKIPRLVGLTFKEEVSYKTINTYKPTKAGKKIYREVICQEEQDQQI